MIWRRAKKFNSTVKVKEIKINELNLKSIYYLNNLVNISPLIANNGIIID